MEFENQLQKGDERIRRAERGLRIVMRQVYQGLSQDIESGMELPVWMKKRGARIILDPGTPHASGIALKLDGGLVVTQGILGPKQRKDTPLTGSPYVNTALNQLHTLNNRQNSKVSRNSRE